MIKYVDIVFGLSWGDEGKGKIINAIAKKYDLVCRWNGGPNAGHTIFTNNKKYKTHAIPSGIFNNKLSIIGPNCVINLEKFYKEVEYLEKEGFDSSLIKVSPKAHIITEKHIKYDLKYLQKKLGTTGQGIAACYADKMIRSGTLAKDKINKKFLWNGELSGRILCEGAQSFWLDINQGNYPYVTSSETLPYAACSLGFSPLKIRNIIGIAKIYDTKSGVDPLFPKYLLKNNQLNTIAELGEEFGTTTGRRRIVNWLNLNKLIESISISGTNQVIINKCDILENANIFKLYFNKNILKFKNIKQMKNFINSKINSHLGSKIKIIYSGDRSLI